MRVWDLATGREQGRFTGHTRWASAVAVTTDGTQAISGSEDGTVRVWNLTTGEEVARWIGDYAVIACSAITGQPLKIGVGHQQGQPYVLELRGPL